MKKLVIIAVLLCSAALVFARGIEERHGDGNPVTMERPLSSFNSIQLSGSAAVYFHESRQYRAVITVDSNLAEYVRVETRGNTLEIGTKRALINPRVRYKVDVYAPSLVRVNVSGSGYFEARDKITAPTFTSNVSGSGEIKGAIECDTFSANISGSGSIDVHVVCSSASAEISGSGSITIAGTGRNTNVSISGDGNFAGREFRTNNAAVRISGSGAVHVWVLDDLKAGLSGSGMVRYRGNPSVEFRGSGSGRLERE